MVFLAKVHKLLIRRPPEASVPAGGSQLIIDEKALVPGCDQSTRQGDLLLVRGIAGKGLL